MLGGTVVEDYVSVNNEPLYDSSLLRALDKGIT